MNNYTVILKDNWGICVQYVSAVSINEASYLAKDAVDDDNYQVVFITMGHHNNYLNKE